MFQKPVIKPVTYVDKTDETVEFDEGFFRACRPAHAGKFLIVEAPVETVQRLADVHKQTGVKLTPGTSRTFS